jgi:TRAP-type C4-dicarboxylate transport system permease small subunit
MKVGQEHGGTISAIINKFDSVMAKFEALVMTLGVVLMAVNTISNVISRFFFNHSIIFAEELNSIFILLVTFAGVGYAARQGRHIRMSAFYDVMPLGQRKWLMRMITLITGLCMLFLAWFASVYVLNIAGKGRIMPALGIPIYITYLWVPVGFFITACQYLSTCYKNFTQGDIYLAIDLKEMPIERVNGEQLTENINTQDEQVNRANITDKSKE